MFVSQLSRQELQSRLSGSGLLIRTGPFVNRLKSSLPNVAQGVSLLYADFPVFDSCEFVDFTVNVNYANRIRRWLLPRAYYLARGGRRPTFGAFHPRLGLSYLEWGLNYSVYGESISSFLTLHAAVLERDGAALIILGDSGAGKSTLCATLTLSGWRLLSDEIALIGTEDGLIRPLARPVSLKNESVSVIQNHFPDATLSEARWTRRKGAVAHLKPPTESVRRMHETAAPRWIVSVQHCDGAPLTVTETSGSQLFSSVLRSAFNSWELGEVGFKSCCQLVDRCVGQSLQYSELNQAIEHFNSPAYQVR